MMRQKASTKPAKVLEEITTINIISLMLFIFIVVIGVKSPQSEGLYTINYI